MNKLKISLASSVRCELAENPLWDERRNCVFWADIPAGKVYQLIMENKTERCVHSGELIGGFTLQSNGDLLLFRTADIALLNLESGNVISLRKFQDQGMKRFNDVIADPEGRVFAGTIGETPQSGGLYRVETNGDITKLFSGTGCANGMGFSRDLKKFYWTCSTTRKIFRFDYDQASGALNNRETFYEATAEEGIPDGLTIDADDFIWSARWWGYGLKRHSHDGVVISSLSIPVRNVTSLCFAGPKLDELFITTAKEPGEDVEHAGALFKVKVPVSGRLEFRSKLIVRD